MENIQPLSELYSALSAKADLLYRFVTYFNDLAVAQHGTILGEEITLVESHILGVIDENPGILSTNLAAKWHRSRSAISQIISKLEKKGFIERVKEEGNDKNVKLFVTELGAAVSREHCRLDAKSMSDVIIDLTAACSPADIDVFFRVITCYTELLHETLTSGKSE